MIETPDTSTGKYHIAICIPSHENVPYQFANSLANMIGYTIHEIGDQVDVTVQWVIGTYVARAREQLLAAVGEVGAHYILWLDSDHGFPKDALIRLLAHDKPVVGVNYSGRKIPCRYIAVKQTIMEGHAQARLCRTEEDSTGLESVEAIGMGMMLMKAAIIPTLPKGEPMFLCRYLESGNFVGEDVHFCKLIRDAGWEILVDHDLSKEITHIGQMAYSLHHVWAMAEEGYDVDYELLGTTDSGGELGESERSDEHHTGSDNAGGEEVGEGQATS